MAAKGIQFPRRWYGGMISANLEVIWVMSVYMPQALSEHDYLALLGPFIVSHLGHIEHTLRTLLR